MLIKYYFKILTILTIFFVIAGCSNHLTYDELISVLPSTRSNSKFSRPTMKYDISLPKELKLVEEDNYNDTLWFEIYVDSTIAYEKGSNTISIMRFLSEEKTTKAAWKKLMSKRMMIENFKIHSEGKTNFLNYPSYYEHASCTISKQNTESISFLVQGKTSDFYLISVQTITEGDYPTNIKKLLSGVRTFNILK